MRRLDMLKPSVMCLVLLSALVPLIAQAPANLPSRLQAIMRDFEAEGFSGVVLVERHGTVEFHHLAVHRAGLVVDGTSPPGDSREACLQGIRTSPQNRSPETGTDTRTRDMASWPRSSRSCPGLQGTHSTANGLSPPAGLAASKFRREDG
jgi:hypothetical protein